MEKRSISQQTHSQGNINFSCALVARHAFLVEILFCSCGANRGHKILLSRLSRNHSFSALRPVLGVGARREVVLPSAPMRILCVCALAILKDM